ncbi:MAG: sulfurtransferase TusA family protein [Gammaproteobacteria bacterium]|nr:sulfurtransferase TusA family protein [Gammaproteobacteria bacterium]
MSHHTLDARNLLCPLPVIRTQDRVSELQPGDTLEVRCTDPGTLHDIPAWCRISGHILVETVTRGDEYVLTVQVGCHS